MSGYRVHIAFAPLIVATNLCLADVTSVQTAPRSQRVPLGQSASVDVIWNITRDNTTANVGPTVTSTGGTFRAGGATGPILGTVSTVLSQAKPVIGTTTAFKMKEVVRVPSALVFQAQKRGATQIVYARSFVDCAACSAGSTTIVLPITSGTAAGFGISRLQLRFEDGSPTQLVQRNTTLQVFADINFSGTGLLEATWELAGPTSTAGEPTFRTVQTVRRYLVAGASPATLSSPVVPTNDLGLYLVTLRVSSPELSFEQPTIRYFVGESARAAGPAAN
jgi:hypothetical protein